MGLEAHVQIIYLPTEVDKSKHAIFYIKFSIN